MTFFWAFSDVSQATLGELLGLDTVHTLLNWFNMHRDLCIDWMRAYPVLIGGPGHVVQIDESLIAKAKLTGNARARPVPERRWGSIAADRGTNNREGHWLYEGN